MEDLAKVAIVIGHKPSKPGAQNKAAGVTEYEFNKDLAALIAERDLLGAEVIIVERTGSYRKLPDQINALNPDYVIELHCNSFVTPDVSGTETLYYFKDKRGALMAKIMQQKQVKALGLNNRGLRARRHDEDVEAYGDLTEKQVKAIPTRGGQILKKTKAPCNILEPFFINNDSDYKIAEDYKTALVDGIASGIEEIVYRGV